MDDLISRQAAIDALDVLCQEHRYKIPGKGETYSQYNEAWQDALDRAEGAIFNLPSAQPKTHDKRTETHACDYINRKDAIDAHYEYCNKHPDAGFPVWSLKILEYLPPAEPEIIRCKDCKYWKDSDGVYRRGFDAESKCPLNLKKVYEGTFYCGMAERRTDENNNE